MEIPTIALMILSGGGGGSKFFGVAGAPFGGTHCMKVFKKWL